MRSLLLPYDTDLFDPPAPVARAMVRGASGLIRDDVPMLLDSGADVSVVPMDVADQVGATVQARRVRIQMYDGSELDLPVTELSLEIFGYRFNGLFVVAVVDHGVIGRNILNLLRLNLDGPALAFGLTSV